MSNKSPIFPMPDSHQFSDYGFDPQLDYFQVLEEAKKQTSARSSIDVLHFKLQKPIIDDEPTRSSFHKNNKGWWWKNALLFFKWRKWPISAVYRHRDDQRTKASAKVHRVAGSISSPIYVTESQGGSSTPYRTSRPTSGPLAGSLTPEIKGEAAIPYASLREVNAEERQLVSTASAVPLYLVT